MTGKTLVLFDADCSVCKMFAEFSSKHSDGVLQYESWQSFQNSDEAAQVIPGDILTQPADRLRVWDGAEIYEKEKAWEFLITYHPQLKGIGWLAEKLGIKAPAAKIVKTTAELGRRFCGRCPRW